LFFKVADGGEPKTPKKIKQRPPLRILCQRQKSDDAISEDTAPRLTVGQQRFQKIPCKAIETPKNNMA
jgi:hypothetical protein